MGDSKWLLLNILWKHPIIYIQPVHSEGDQPWDFFGRNDAKAETPVLWPPHAKSWLIGKDPDAGRGWRQEEKGTTEDEMAGWHHWLDGPESEWTPGVGDGQGGLACCDSWGRKELDTTERLIWSDVETTLIAYFSSAPTCFYIHWWFLAESVIPVMVLKSLLVVFYCRVELPIFLHLFIYSFTYFTMDLWIPVLFSGF